MMYRMKNIVSYDDEIALPQCMYRIKNPNESVKVDEINIHDQVMKFLKLPNKNMTELELRQDQLLKKLDVLYERIKKISSQCVESSPKQSQKHVVRQAISTPDEIVLVLSPDNLPYFLNILMKVANIPVNLSWHIHSSVPNEKVAKIKAFVKKLPPMNGSTSVINLRLIFKNVSADTELKLSPLAVPIVGNVNILRYLAMVYPNIVHYDEGDYQMDSLLDLCHLLERAPEKNKEAMINKLFGQNKEWICGDQFSIVDIAAYNVIKQWQNKGKHVPKAWFDKCEKMSV